MSRHVPPQPQGVHHEPDPDVPRHRHDLRAIPGVTDVTVDLVAGGTSTVHVTAEQPVTDEQISTALDEAGNYQLAN